MCCVPVTPPNPPLSPLCLCGASVCIQTCMRMQVWTIVFSMFYSLVFFMSMCAVFGPTGEVGAFYTLCGLLKKDKKTP